MKKSGKDNPMKRHGDVVISLCDKIPGDAKRLTGRDWLALGEVTGHAHRIDCGELFETKDGKLYLRVEKLCRVTHEEHKTLILEPGVYHVGIKRQYSPEGWSKVSD